MKATAEVNERVGRLETSVGMFHEDFTEIRASLKSIQDTLSLAKATNWPVIFATLALVGALYAAAIRPLSEDVNRTAVSAAKLAEAVLIQNDKIMQLQITTTILADRAAANAAAAAAAAAAVAAAAGKLPPPITPR